MGTCSTGFVDCDGQVANGCERDVRSDVNNCGACGNRCTSGVCVAGQCGLRVLISSGTFATELSTFLQGWGFTTTVLPGSSLNSTIDYSQYDVVAFMYDSTISDSARLLSANAAGRPGIVCHRCDSLMSSFDLGATGYWQQGSFAVTNNSHYITQPFAVGALDVTYTYKSIVNTPSANTRTLGTATSPSLVVHNTYRRLVTPYYGHTSGMPWSVAGETLTRRSYEWAAGLGAQ